MDNPPGIRPDRATAAYVNLVNWLGSEERNARGWKKRAVDRLGITPQHLSKILSGEKQVGVELVRRANQALGLDAKYFDSYGEGMSPSDYIRMRHAARHASLFDVYSMASALLRRLGEGQMPSIDEAREMIWTLRDARVSFESEQIGDRPDHHAVADSVYLATIVVEEVRQLVTMIRPGSERN